MTLSEPGIGHCSMDMDFLQRLIQDYGYLALFIGTFLEGETILLLAGFAAHSDKFQLDIVYVILTAFAGSLSGDQLAFYIGRYFGKKLVGKSEKWRSRIERVHRMLEKYHEILILSFRFFYGLRNLTPFTLGSTPISGAKFFALNAIGALVWAIVFALVGYVFGSVLENVLVKALDNVHHAQFIILGLAAVIAFFFWIRKIYKKR